MRKKAKTHKEKDKENERRKKESEKGRKKVRGLCESEKERNIPKK